MNIIFTAKTQSSQRNFYQKTHKDFAFFASLR